MTSAKKDFNWHHNYEALKAYILDKLPPKNILHDETINLNSQVV